MAHHNNHSQLNTMDSSSSNNMEPSYMEPKMAQDNSLSRQLTLNISPEQYEKLFFQPTAAKGDLAKRLGMYFLLLDFCPYIFP